MKIMASLLDVYIAAYKIIKQRYHLTMAILIDDENSN
jgi:hypothetical protein